MKRLLCILLVTLLVPSGASADETAVDCGTYENLNKSYQYGDYNWLEYIVETRRKVDLLCAVFSSVGVAAYVVNVSGSAASHDDSYTASVRRQIQVPDYGRYQTNGAHYRYWLGLKYDNGSTVSHADVTQKAPSAATTDCSIYDGGGNYYVWNGYECVECPIIVDTARNGYHLTSPAEGVLFDLNADGVPERTAWTRADSDDALLAMDRNGNGVIDDGSELFGNRTRAYADRDDVTTVNGFEALRFLQENNPDRQIDARDPAFDGLLLWRDVNHNGISETEELAPLGETVAAIGTDYQEKKRVDRFGNQFRQKGQITWADGTRGIVYDVWLRRGQ